jgi:hypothetical protein
MIVLPLKIVVWIAVVWVFTLTDRWSVWLGLAAAVIFTFFDGSGFEWTLLTLEMFTGYWLVASVTLAAFGRFENLLARVLIMGAGSFLLILGPLLIPMRMR